jgi:hypothetical protein
LPDATGNFYCALKIGQKILCFDSACTPEFFPLMFEASSKDTATMPLTACMMDGFQRGNS